MEAVAAAVVVELLAAEDIVGFGRKKGFSETMLADQVEA